MYLGGTKMGGMKRRSHEKTGNHKHSENIERLAY